MKRLHLLRSVTITAAVLGVTGCGGAVRTPVEHAPPPTPPVIPSPAPGAGPLSPDLHPPAAVRSRDVPATVAVLPQYEGVWAGRSSRTQCAEFGGAVGVACRSVPESQMLTLEMAQQGSLVRGVLTVGQVHADVVGSVGADGVLTLRGEHAAPTYTFSLRGWRSTAQGSDMQGTFSYVVDPQNHALGRVAVTASVDVRARR